MSTYATAPNIDTASMETLLEPTGERQGHWVGAPCVHRHDGSTYLAVRWRDPDRRGWKATIYEYESGGTLTELVDIEAAALGVVSVERLALVTNPHTGDLQCFLPVDRGGNDWIIRKLADVTHPSEFDPTTARTVLKPVPGTADAGTVKDPVIETVGGRYFMFYAGADGRSEQAHLATSVDGETWERYPDNPVIDRAYWHDHHTRVSAVVPAPDAPVWLVFYEGSGVSDVGRTWNLRTGLAVSPDLERLTDVSHAGPLYSAPTADRAAGVQNFATCRYLDVLDRGEKWQVFAEVAREDESFALKTATVPAP